MIGDVVVLMRRKNEDIFLFWFIPTGPLSYTGRQGTERQADSAARQHHRESEILVVRHSWLWGGGGLMVGMPGYGIQ